MILYVAGASREHAELNLHTYQTVEDDEIALAMLRDGLINPERAKVLDFIGGLDEIGYSSTVEVFEFEVDN